LQSLVILGGILTLAFSLSFLILRAAARELSRAQDLLHLLATRDALTGLSNRAEIMERLREETTRWVRKRETEENAAFSLVMVDIDRFKGINDRYGHPAGDRVLKEVAQKIQGALRQYDRVGRYGGEEFLVLLPQTDVEGARQSAERIRQAVEEKPVTLEATNLPVTVSLGVARIHFHEEDYQEVLKRADEGLYLAKERGRNRVCLVAEGAEKPLDAPPTIQPSTPQSDSASFPP
jgi:diguanylate cyclase (GGDEF)-like protein